MQHAENALVVCPTGSIGMRKPMDLGRAIGSYPEELEEGVYLCGFASRYSYGASSYLIVRPKGNILVDSPRFTSALVRRFDELGGISMMFLTHRDDVADHEKFHDHFGCERIITVLTVVGCLQNVFWKVNNPSRWVKILPSFLRRDIRAGTPYCITKTAFFSQETISPGHRNSNN